MANLNDLLIPWSEKLPQEIQNIDFEISEGFSSIGVDPQQLAQNSSVEIISSINEQIFNNLGRNTEALFGTNFISFVALQVIFDELLTSNFMDLFNSSSFIYSPTDFPIILKLFSSSLFANKKAFAKFMISTEFIFKIKISPFSANKIVF